MSDLFVDNIKHQSSQGSGTITLGASGETIALASGASVTGNGLVGITMADQWRLTANLTANALPITSNLERVDEAAFGGIGTGMTESSGVFSFPQTGIYLVRFTAFGQAVINDNLDITIEVTTDNSTYNDFTVTGASGDAGTGNCSMTAEAMIDVTDTSNVKVRFEAGSIGSGSSILGNTDVNYTYMTFIRLGDT